MFFFNWRARQKEVITNPMKQFINFVKKEFIHIMRDSRTLFILIGMPMVQILIFGFALTNEVKNSRFAVIDLAKDEQSQKLINRMDASQYFECVGNYHSIAEIEAAFRKGKIRIGLVIPQHFGNDLKMTDGSQLQLIADASDPNVANTLVNYAQAVIGDFEKEVSGERVIPYTIVTETKMMYNPQLKGAYNFVPGVMAMVLLLVCTMMTALTVVREKELGTMEIMLVSPIRPIKIILAKAVPYLLLSIFNIATILLLSVFVLDVPIRGNLALLFSESILFILVSLSLGLFISSSTDSQQSAMFISLVGMFLPTVMLSGFMFPIENMPLPLRTVSNIVPAKWFYIIVRSVMIKGVGLHHVWKETLVLFGMFVFFMTLAIKKFKVRLS
jgi:ABC-2 type transport system permease protein